VNISHSLPGWTNKPFLITAKGEDSYGRMQFEVIAYYSGIYDDAEAVDQTNYASDLPNPHDPPSSATGISLSLASPGTGFDYDSVKVSFSTPADPFYSYSEIYISNDDSTYYLAGTSSGEDFVIQGMGMFYVPGDTVYVKLRSVSETGVFGSMSTAESIGITSSIRLGSFYAGLHDFWGGNAAINNAATTIVLGNLDGTPKLALGPSADSLTLNNVDTYKGFYADGDGNFRHGGPSAYGIFDATAGTYTFHGVTISSDVTIEGSGSTANTWTINSDLDDVNVQLILGRTTGGNATLQWDGSELTSNIATDGDGSLQQIVTKEYVDYSVTSLGASYYLVDTSSGVADYKLCSLIPSGDAETYLEAADLSDNDYIGGWISDTGETPDILLTGNFNFYITAEKTTGTKTLKLYWKMYERKSDTSEVLIATSSITNEVTDKDTFILPFLLTSDYIPASGSRIVGKIYASVTGGGNAPTVRIYYRGNTAARWDIPANSEVFRNIFVPYANAVQDVDLNGHSITGIDNITIADESWIGIGASDERIVFDTAGNISFMGCKVGVGTVPTAKLDVKLDNIGDYFRIQRSASNGRSQYVLATETAAEMWRCGMTGEGLTDYAFYGGTHNNLVLERAGNSYFNGNTGFNTTTPRKQIDSLSTSQAQLRLSYSDNSVYADFHVNSNGNLTVSPTGDFVFDPIGNDVYPNTNYDLNLGLINKKFLTLHAAELWVETLVAQETLATIGGRIVVAPTTTLTSDIGTGDTTIYVKHNNLANGDRIYMEANGKVEFMAVTSDAGGSGPYSYSVTRNLDGTGANTWYAGDAILNTGTTGDGFIDIYSLRGIKEASDYGPTIVGNIRNSSTYNDWTEAWAVGNLNGLYGYGNDIYGAAFGKYSAADYITIDPTNGIRFFDSSDVIQAQLKSSEWTIGQVAASKSNIRISSGVLQLRNNTTVKTQLNTDGSGWLAGDGKFNWDTSGNITMTGSITLTNQISSSDISDVEANADATRFVNSADSNGTGWRRVAHIDGAGGRGSQIVSIYTEGGDFGPECTTVQWFHDWDSQTSITILHHTSSAYWNQVRITDDGTNSYLEFNFTTDVTDFEIELQRIGYFRGDIYSGTLSAGGDTVRETQTLAGNPDKTSAQFSNSLTTIDASTDKVELGLNSSGALITKVIPASNVAPSGAGLYMGADYLGYYDSSAWKTYMDNSGNFYLGGTSGPLQWDAGTSTLTLGVDAFANLPSDEDLVGYWAFDDGSGSIAVDGSGNGNSGTLVNMEEADWVDGVVGKCLSFDGTNDYVEILSGNISTVYQDGDWTISFWMNPTVKQVDHVFSFKSGNTFYRAGSDSATWSLLGSTSLNNIDLSSYDTVGTWTHYVLSYNATSNVVTIYANGEDTGEGGSYIPFTGTTGTDKFGFRYTGGLETDHLYGKLDEVRIYDRASTPSEAKALFLYPAGNKATKISGSQITTGKIQSTNWVDGTSGSMLDLDNELFAIKDDTFGNSGIQIIWDSGAKFYAGDGSNKYFKFDGTNISWKGVNTELTAAGAFTASNATITGTINASGGTFTGNVTAGTAKFGVDVTSGNDGIWLDANNYWYTTGVKAVTGTIGGWTLSSTTLANGTNIILDASNKKISIKNATFGNEGIQLEYNAGSPRFYVGDGSNEYLKYIQGTGLSLSTAQANAITIESGGSIKLKAGGDIKLIGSDTNAGKLILDGTDVDVEIYAAATGNNVYIAPTSHNVTDLYLGGASNKYHNIYIRGPSVIEGDMIPGTNSTWDIGGSTMKFVHGFFSGDLNCEQVIANCNLDNDYAGTFFNDGNSANRYGIKVQAGSDDAQQCDILRAFDGDGDIEGYLRISNGTFDIYQASDRSMKMNIRNTEVSGLNIVNSLKVCDFEFKKTPTVKHTNFIADEVEKVFPDAIGVADGKYWLASNAFIPILVKALQEENDFIKSEIARLEELIFKSQSAVN